MISIFAFKLSLVYMVPYIYLATHPEIYATERLGLTTSYLSIERVTSVSRVKLSVGDMSYETRLVTNNTNAYILVDLPPTLSLCDMLLVHAPALVCASRETVSSELLMQNLNPEFIRRAFSLPDFNYMDKQQILALVTSSSYDYPFMVQSFPPLAVKLQAPVLLREGNDCGAQDCSQPRVTDFFVDGIRDTFIYGAVHLGTKYVFKPYVLPTVGRVFGPIFKPPYQYLKEPFINWYNRALYAADSMTARAFESGAPASLQNVARSSVVLEMNELLPNYAFAGPTVSDIPTGSFTSLPSSSASGSSLAVFRSPIGSSSAITTATGAVPNLVSSSADAGASGMIRHAGMRRYVSTPVLPSIGRGTQAVSALSKTTIDTMIQVPATGLATGELASINIIKSNSRSVLSAMSRALRFIPKRRRRQAGYLSRKIATSIRGIRNMVEKIPSWVSHSVGLTIPWVFSGTTNLRTFDVTIKTIFPIQKLAPYERYFIAMFTLLAAQCYHDSSIRTLVLSRHPANETVSIGGRELTPADVLFDVKLGLPGDTLQECLSLFRGQVRGVERELLLETISIHFDSTYIIGDIIFYNGPARYIINDYIAYFNDVFPAFSPYLRHSDSGAANLEKVEQYNNNFLRSKRSYIRERRGTYTYHSRPLAETRLTFKSSSSFTTNIQHLLEVPRLRYEFDILQSSHYNTSFSYYHSLRKYASSQSLNFGDRSSSSEFRMLGNITVIEVIRGLNPFDIYLPRLNLIREMIGGYNVEFDLRRLREVSVGINVRLEYADLPTIIGLFYLIRYPTDTSGFKSLREKTVTPVVMQRVINYLYRHRYARVPILIVVQNNDQLDKLKKMFVTHVRRQDDIQSWTHYSPIMITTALSMIPSGAYSICVSRTKSHTSKTSLFGDTSSDLGLDALFFDACDLASIHVTYDTHIEELIENMHLPDRIKSLLSVSEDGGYTPPSGGVYDPILSELIDRVEPSHRDELLAGVRGSHDDEPALGGRIIAPAIGSGTSDSKTYALALGSDSDTMQLFFNRNWIMLGVTAVLMLIAFGAIYKLCPKCHTQKHHRVIHKQQHRCDDVSVHRCETLNLEEL